MGAAVRTEFLCEATLRFPRPDRILSADDAHCARPDTHLRRGTGAGAVLAAGAVTVSGAPEWRRDLEPNAAAQAAAGQESFAGLGHGATINAKVPRFPRPPKGLPMRLTPALLLTLLCLPLGFTACGDDDDDDEGGSQPQVFEVQATEERNESQVTAPPSVRPGPVEVRFSNTGKRPHSLQIIEIGEGHSAAETLKAGEAWGEEGEALPEWIRFIGGIASTKPGGSGIAVVDLPAGEYAAFDIEGEGPRPYAEFTVEGDEGAALPEVPAVIEAVDYDFNPGQIEAGSQQVLFENNGEEPHHLVAAPMKPGKTEADLKEAVESDGGPPPIVQSKTVTTAIVSGGESAVVDLRFESGDYAFVCFTPDRAGGPPHAVKGMATVAPVG
jgi:plastocyanin